jgi:hypothetical protein
VIGVWADEHRHDEAGEEEWCFTTWQPDGSVGLISGYRIVGPTAWYWAALARAGEPLLHVTDWSVARRSDPLLVKGAGLWAEHICDAPMEQWTVANETYAAALEHPDDALGRAYGTPTALSWDLEWYATAPPSWRDAVPGEHGYRQEGVVHGVVELGGTAGLHLEEAPARRWHRWGEHLPVVEAPDAVAHRALRAVFAFPDGSRLDWVLAGDGWRRRRAL